MKPETYKWPYMAGVWILALTAALAGAQSIPQAGYQVISVDNPGQIDGTVKWSGPIPNIPKLAITKDQSTCDPDSKKTRDLERLLISSDRGVANSVVYLKISCAEKPWTCPWRGGCSIRKRAATCLTFPWSRSTAKCK